MQRFPLATVQVQAPILFAIGMMIGASWYFLIEFEPDFRVLLSVFGLSALAVLTARPRGIAPGMMIGLWIILGTSSGALSGGLATQRVQHVSIVQETGPVLLEGWVQAALPAKRGVRLRIKVHAIDGLDQNQTPPIVRVTHISTLETEPGRFVRCWVVLRPPPAPVIKGDYAFDRQAWYGGLGGVGYVQGRCRGGAIGTPRNAFAALMLQISKARRQLAQHVFERAGTRSGGFAAALASGDRSFMAQADQEALRGAGLAHLLAISGLHMGIVGGLVFLIVWRGLALVEPVALRLPVKKLGAVAALVACATYLILSGASVSTQRAFVMAAILFGAVLIDRTALSLRSLAIAMVVILVLAPWSVLTPGFQMSFAATGALVATYERWNTRRRNALKTQSSGVTFWIKSLIVTSTVSSFATMPFALYHFERAAPLGLIANLFAMPIVSLVTAPSAAAALLLAPLGLDGLALRALGVSLWLILEIAHFFSQWDVDAWITVPHMPGQSFAFLGAGIVLFCLIRGPMAAWSTAAGLTLMAAFAWVQSGADKVHIAPSGDVFLEHASGQIERMSWREGDGLGPLRFSDYEINQTCGAENGCDIAFAGHILRFPGLSGDAEIEVFANANMRAQPISRPSMLSISWAETVRENGVTLTFKNGSAQKQLKPDCSSRAWRTCRVDDP